MNAINIVTKDVNQCNLCGSEGVEFRKNIHDPDHQIKEGWNYKICKNKDCSSIWLSPRPIDSELFKAYGNYHTHTKERRSLIQKISLSFTKRLLSIISTPHEIILGVKSQATQMKLMGLQNDKPGSLLELGVGGGRFLFRMKKRGWDVTGVDIDPKVAERILEKYQINVYTGDVTNIEIEKQFDVITLNQTVEHLIDPLAVLKKCYQLLNPGGRIVITTPNVESLGAKMFGEYWRGWEPPRHLYLYSTKSLENLIKDADFEVNKIETYTCESQIGYYSSYLNEAYQKSNQLNTLKLIYVMIWSYWMEFRETLLNRKTNISGQGIYLVGFKNQLKK
ncbi:class I SAM-dependent methyltransferase [Sideroxydans sp. CL21]|uniref:class I SAM-dependent methyltransferase n=1 Tax=Sideroxydans sp. CL21 TaxID=2600596 RepID=UPI0024BD0844|nr:class I SAM-dependent methyltransferase [Sideroxydans sp. CL21]